MSRPQLAALFVGAVWAALLYASVLADPGSEALWERGLLHWPANVARLLAPGLPAIVIEASSFGDLDDEASVPLALAVLGAAAFLSWLGSFVLMALWWLVTLPF